MTTMPAKPDLLQRYRNESRRTPSAAEQVPDQAGAQYVTFATTVASTEHVVLQREVDGMPCIKQSVYTAGVLMQLVTQNTQFSFVCSQQQQRAL